MSEDQRAAALASEPPRRILTLLLWVVLIAFSSVPLVLDVSDPHALALRGQIIGRDFLNAWAGGRLAFEGRVSDVYPPDRYMEVLQQLLGFRPDFHAFSYPPTLLLFLWPFGLIPYFPALLTWIVTTGAGFIAAARPYLRREDVPLWMAALLPASIVNVWAGHHGFVFSALWLAAFASIKRRPVIAGLLIALLTLKPHMGLVIALLLVVRREWRTIGWAAAGTIALVIASVATFGVEPWVNYFRFIAPLQADLLSKSAGAYLQMMPTPYVSFWMALHSMTIAVIAQALFAIAALGIVIRTALRGTGWPELGLMGATATFLIVPYAFNYDMEVVGIGAILLLYGKSARFDFASYLAALIALAAPAFIFIMTVKGVPLLPFALLYFLWVQSKRYTGAAENDKNPLETAAAAPA